MKPPLIVRPAVARLRAEVRGPKALAKVGRNRLGSGRKPLQEGLFRRPGITEHCGQTERTQQVVGHIMDGFRIRDLW